jgi:quercetin dioxygenase-like cupin family protein
MSSAFLRVASAIATYATLHPEPRASPAIRHLADSANAATPRSTFTAMPNPHHSALLATALAAAGGNPIATALAALRDPLRDDQLPWHYHYKPRDDAPDLASRIAFAELIGPRGPLTAPECRIGFTVMAPHTVYPLHRHPAVELYLVISGTAEWIAPPSQHHAPPGSYILHGTNQPHAMRTTAEPLLALYAWSGDLESPATYI